MPYIRIKLFWYQVLVKSGRILVSRYCKNRDVFGFPKSAMANYSIKNYVENAIRFHTRRDLSEL